jgi:tol-pal system protein YbgF
MGPGGDRIGRLEAQVADLRAMVAALQSLVSSRPSVTLPHESGSGSPPSAAPSFGGSGALTARVDALETQIGALTGQLELMTQQLAAFQGSGNGSPPPQSLSPSAPQDSPLLTRPAEQMPQGLLPNDENAPRDVAPNGPPGRSANADDDEGWFGRRDDGNVTGSVGTPGPIGGPDRPGESGALSLYNQGYNHFLSGDYEAAAKAFEEIAERYPDDPVTGKAKYWLGEAHYVQGDFKDAAEAFLSSFKTAESGEKAPDSLLKLAMSLEELGKEDESCSTLKELESRFPRANLQLQGQVQAARRKAGC